MSSVYGLYSSPHSAERAYQGLREAGVAPSHIAVMSSEPMEEYEFGSQDRKTLMPWIAVLGAAVGLTGAYLLTSVTQLAWPINTGGMPTITNWTNIIIMFELTMLGAVFATILTLAVTAKVPGRVPGFYDPAVSQGKILIGAMNLPEAKIANIEKALRAAGAESVQTR
jgi:hypothetical protein